MPTSHTTPPSPPQAPDTSDSDGCDTQVPYLPEHFAVGLRQVRAQFVATHGRLPRAPNSHISVPLPAVFDKDAWFLAMEKAEQEGLPLELIHAINVTSLLLAESERDQVNDNDAQRWSEAVRESRHWQALAQQAATEGENPAVCYLLARSGVKVLPEIPLGDVAALGHQLGEDFVIDDEQYVYANGMTGRWLAALHRYVELYPEERLAAEQRLDELEAFQARARAR